MENQIKGLAEKVVSLASAELDINLKYDQAAVEWLEGYIERIRPHVEESSIDGLANSLGAFLGECIIANYGGEWREKDGTWGVYFDDRNAVYPFAKVQKQLLNGKEDSILSFYTIIPIIKRSNDV